MNLFGTRMEAWAARISLVLLLTGGVAAQTPAKTTDVADADKSIEGLRQVSRELAEAVKRFHADIDETVARYDRGYRASDDRLIQGADSGLTGGPADVVQETIRKFAAFRMLAARNDKYNPPPVADMDRIQNLIAEAHQRVDASAAVLRRLLVVSVKDFDPRRDAQVKTRHDQLLKARSAAEDASKLAWLALPIDLPPADDTEESSQKALDILSRGWSDGVRTAQSTPATAPAPKLHEPAAAIPIRIARRQRFTLVSDISYRMALTDSGIDDATGRRLFYEEEWIQRGASVIRVRWRVAVDTATGEQVLVKRYPMLELRGTLDDIYPAMDRYSLWYMEPPDETTRPSPDEVETALAEVEDARTAIRTALDDFQNATRASLALHDQGRASTGRASTKEALLDAGLAGQIRETLYAIRAHLAGVPASIEAESKVWQAITEARSKVVTLESLASWANRTSEEADEWEQLLDRSERAMDLIRTAENEAAASLPPNSSQAEAKFPALQRGVIVRIRRPPKLTAAKGLVLCQQEIWHMESPMPGSREVRRTATLVAVDPRTGTQTAVGGRTKYYPVDASGLLEQVFDEYAADDLPLAVVD